jgi:RnfABCDGE-type electron transport complex C subunit
MNDILNKIRQAGIVGAGGAGFPAHVKLAAKAEIFIVNGAECEPLLRVDQQMMERYPGELIKGIRYAMQTTGAREGIIALKSKYKPAIAALEPLLPADMRIHILKDVYPAGDEVITIWMATGRRVPPGKLPLDVGVVVSNVQTLINISHAVETGKPVTHRTLTVTGAVRKPVTVTVPIGTTYADAFAMSGGSSRSHTAVVEGGPMMGHLVHDMETPITKTTGALISLPEDNIVVQRHKKNMDSVLRIAKATCEQCCLCTELCPRHLIGHELPPHLIVRSLNYNHIGSPSTLLSALTCSECAICEAWACPVDISPMRINIALKAQMREQGLRYEGELRPLDPMAEYRLVPTKRLLARLGIEEYNVAAPLVEQVLAPAKVRIPLKQHIGTTSLALVNEGDSVVCGQAIGEIPESAMGARIHASIDGRVTAVTPEFITINR